MPRCLAAAAFALAFLAISPVRAGAQPDAPRFSIAAGAGVAMPLHGDLDFTAPEWQVSVRGAVSRHFALEGFFSDWRHDTTRVLLDQAIQGPTGFLGRVGRIEETTAHKVRVVGVNALATGTAGRATVAGGGGIGMWLFDRRFRQASTGCEPAVADLCRTVDNTFNSDSQSAQGVVELDVAVTRRLHVFGRYQLVLLFQDPGSGHGSAAGGVRIALW